MFWDSYPEIRSEIERVQRLIEAEVSRPGGAISRGLLDLTRRDSKLLRPAFAILAARIRSGERPVSDRVIRVAAAIEMLHLASLIHDDIVDESTTRRGGPTLHLGYGTRSAVLMGDYLFARCFALVADYAEPESAALLSAAGSHLIGSEIEETTGGRQSASSVRGYLRRVIGKTAVLFAMSFHVGAVHCDGSAGSSDEDIVSVLRRIGYNIGVGFQIVDDLLDLFGDSRRTGKPSAGDVRQGVTTLPIVLASRTLRGDRLLAAFERTRRISRLARRPFRFVGERSIDRLRQSVERAGGRQAAEAVARRYTQRALREINRLPACEDRVILERVTEQLLVRAS